MSTSCFYNETAGPLFLSGSIRVPCLAAGGTEPETADEGRASSLFHHTTHRSVPVYLTAKVLKLQSTYGLLFRTLLLDQ